MHLAVEIWFVDLPWWIVVPGGLALLGLLLFLAWWWWDEREFENWEDEERGRSQIVYPYYMEGENLRSLAQTVKLELPTARSITKGKKFSIGGKGAAGEKGSSETQEFSGSIQLPKLAEAVERSWEVDGTGPATSVADAAYVSDETALAAAIEQIQGDFEATSQTAELLSRVKEVFAVERVEALSAKKREQFEEIAKRNQMMVFKGQFAFKENSPPGSGPTLKLTHFNPTPGFTSPRSSSANGEIKADLIPVPEGVAVTVVLPDEQALNPAGRERINRKEPFYAGLIAHSPSFNSETGTLTCSAWAIWGQQTPDWEERVRHGYAGGARGAPYGC